MKFQFAERHAGVTEDVREYARKKISKLEKYFKKEAETQITFLRQAGRYVLEVTVNNDGMFYRAKVNSDDLHGAIDSSINAIERQIHKNKTRLEKRLRQGAFERDSSVQAPPLDVAEEEYTIYRTKRFNLKPMTPEEAILQMNMLNHEFFVFRNFSNNSAFTVVYKRSDGGYGLIEEG